MRYILHYTQPGDIIFDGFCGTGMTGVAAQMCASSNEVLKLKEDIKKSGIRHAICTDLSPIASLISSSYNLYFNPIEFEKKALNILDKVEKELSWMYTTLDKKGNELRINYTVWSDVYVCPQCGKEIILWDRMVDMDNRIIKDLFNCPHCNMSLTKKTMQKHWESTYDTVLKQTCSKVKKVPVFFDAIDHNNKHIQKSVDSYDMEMFSKIENISNINTLSYRMPEGDESRRNDRIGIKYIHQFYSKRNFVYLSRIKELVSGNPVL